MTFPPSFVSTVRQEKVRTVEECSQDTLQLYEVIT